MKFVGKYACERKICLPAVFGRHHAGLMQTKINFSSCDEKQTMYVHTYIHTYVAPQPRTVTNRAVEAEKKQ